MDELIDARSEMLHKQLDRRRSNRFLIVMGVLCFMTLGLISFAFVTNKSSPEKPPKQTVRSLNK